MRGPSVSQNLLVFDQILYHFISLMNEIFCSAQTPQFPSIAICVRQFSKSFPETEKNFLFKKVFIFIFHTQVISTIVTSEHASFLTTSDLKGAMTFDTTTFRIMTIKITTFSVKTFNKRHISPHSANTLHIMTLVLSLKTLSIINTLKTAVSSMTAQ